MARDFRHNDDGPLAPLNLAGYLTWLAVSSGPLLRLPSLTPDLPTAAGLVGSLGFLALFVWRSLRRAPDWALDRWLVLAQVPATLLAVAGWRDGLQPVLMIIVAAQAALLFAPRSLVLVLAIANAMLLATLLTMWPTGAALRSFAAYLGFQGFACLLAIYALRAERARDQAQHLAAELLATRALLAEGARAGERLHLSRELHDVAGQKLTALKMQLALLERRAPTELAAGVKTLRELADELLVELRAVVGTLRRSDGVDLHAALQALVRAFPQPQVVLDLPDELRAPDLARAEALLRAAQEALTNAARHSGAGRVTLRLAPDADRLVLEVRDDGHGLRGAPPGYGLTGMRERLEAVGGTLALDEPVDGGLCLRASVPAGGAT